jgi:hypothetical protein
VPLHIYIYIYIRIDVQAKVATEEITWTASGADLSIYGSRTSYRYICLRRGRGHQLQGRTLRWREGKRGAIGAGRGTKGPSRKGGRRYECVRRRRRIRRGCGRRERETERDITFRVGGRGATEFSAEESVGIVGERRYSRFSPLLPRPMERGEFLTRSTLLFPRGRFLPSVPRPTHPLATLIQTPMSRARGRRCPPFLDAIFSSLIQPFCQSSCFCATIYHCDKYLTIVSFAGEISMMPLDFFLAVRDYGGN